MSAGRNDPCPCGSGLKYKKCCGSSQPEQTEKSSQPQDIERIRLEAYQGDTGRKREKFCLEYTAFKQAAIAAVEADLRREVTRVGRTITCSKGCSECCSAFITTTLQECEAIVYHLYQNSDKLTRFLANYPVWRARIGNNEGFFRQLCVLERDIMSGPTTPERLKGLQDALEQYIVQRIPCPFLVDGACAIYEVRPYVCAGVVSTSPPEWCNLAEKNHGKITISKADTDLANDMPYFIRPLRPVTWLCMPEAVHEILTGGFTALSRYLGRPIG